MEREVDPVESCLFKRSNHLTVKKCAVGLERDDTHFVDLLQGGDESGKPGVHQGFSG
jgi:hypothetical protein